MSIKWLIEEYTTRKWLVDDQELSSINPADDDQMMN